MYEAASIHKDLMEKQEQHKTMRSLQDQLDKNRVPATPESDRVGMTWKGFMSEDKDSNADMDIFLHRATAGTVGYSYQRTSAQVNR